MSEITPSYSRLLYRLKLTFKDDAAAVHGMPVSLQLTGRKLQEEKVLKMAQRVLDALAL